jgi:lipoprotein-anchoring transpeptidase ErfK/SrfK
VQVQPGDTLEKIAGRAGTTVELLRSINGVQGDRIRIGQVLKVPVLTFTVHIDKSQNTLTLRWGGRFFKRYAVSTGAGGNTPVGEFTLVNRIVHPDWWHPETGEQIPYGDPRHRIGTHWLGWDRKGFGIHGTDEPELIGQAVSLGCVRLRNEDLSELYQFLPLGTRIQVVE